MKKSNLLGICSVLAILLTACNPGEKPSNTSTSEGPGFTYTHPESSVEDEFVIDIDYSGNDIIKNKISDIDNNKANYVDLIDLIDDNPLPASKGTVVISDAVKYDINQDGNTDNDPGNLEINQTYSFQRNNETHSKSGTLTYKAKVNDKPTDGKEVTTKVTNIEDGVYSLTVDTKNYKIHENYDFKNEELNKTNEFFLNESNLRKNMQVINLENYQERINKKYNTWKDEESEDVEILSNNDETTFTITLRKTIIVETVRNIEEFVVVFAREGYVKETSWKNIFESETTTPEKYDLLLEKHAVNYTFVL